MIKRPELRKAEAPAISGKRRDELHARCQQVLRDLAEQLQRPVQLPRETLRQALTVAFAAGSYGLPDDRASILNRLGVRNFLDEMDAMEQARRNGNLFFAYFGYRNSSSMLNAEFQKLQWYLARLIFTGMTQSEIEKRIRTKIRYRMPRLLFNSSRRNQVLHEALTLLQKHPFVNSKIVFTSETIRQAALFHKDRLLHHNAKLHGRIEDTLARGKKKIIALAISAMQGYRVQPYAIIKIRTRIWRGGLFRRGLRAQPDSNLLMTLFNTFCAGFEEFLSITNTPGKLALAEKLRRKGYEDDSNYLKAAAIYLRHGEIGKATGLQSELYARRPIFISSGEIVDQSSTSHEIGKMIDVFKKWENRVRVNWNPNAKT